MIVDRRSLITGAIAASVIPGIAVAGPLTRLRIVGDRIFLPASIDGHRAEAVLDSAAETSVVDRVLAARLGLRGGTAATARGTGAATTEATLVAGVELFVAGVRLRPAAVGVIDLNDISRRLGEPIDLIVGRDLFDAARLAIDLDAATLATIAPREAPRGTRLPLTARRGIEGVPLTIEGIAAKADFDFGNGGTVLIGAAFAARHRLLDGRPTSTIPGGGIGGEVRQTTFTLRSLDLAGHRFTDVPVAIDASPTAADANIGVRLLRHFGTVTDFAARGIWLDFRR